MIGKREIALLSLAFAASISTAAFAGADDKVFVGPQESVPALIVARDAPCQEDYGSELREAGLGNLHVDEFRSLRAMARIVGLPRTFVPQHLLIAGGYVFVDHVAPAKVVETLRTKPNISGLIGSARCPDAINHQAIYGEPVRVFGAR